MIENFKVYTPWMRVKGDSTWKGENWLMGEAQGGD